jgi:hypothetical protein
VDELKEDVVIDIRRSQRCDLDELLKTNLFSVLKHDSQEKKDLDRYQELIENLERKLDASSRANTAERNQENVHNAKNQAQGKSINTGETVLLTTHASPFYSWQGLHRKRYNSVAERAQQT